MNKCTNFDLLLVAAATEYCENPDAFGPETGTAATFPPPTRREYRRFRRILRESRRPSFRLTPWKVVLIAVLLALSAAFTACICIERIRTAIKEVVTRWFPEYVAVDFQSVDEVSELSIENETALPERIMQKAYVAGLPEGYETETKRDDMFHYLTLYYYNNEYRFSLSQNVISKESYWHNSKRQDVVSVYFNQIPAVVFMESIEDSIYTITWQDGQYEYSLSGHFNSEVDLFETACKVLLEE